jgi:8-oxo-dGTP diphosphatase
MKLIDQVREILNPTLCEEEVYHRFQQRIKKGELVREDNPKSHFCVYFLPFNPKNKKVFIVHHKKANLWITTGGHIEKDESISKALSREVKEELGLSLNKNQIKEPFLLTITDINNPPQVCRVHFDLWHLIQTDGENFNLDCQEFYQSQWINIHQARKFVTDANHQKAFSLLEKHL